MKISWGFMIMFKRELRCYHGGDSCNNRLNKREDEYGPWRIGKEILMMEYGDDSLEIGGEGDKYLRLLLSS
ncbi:MAG: hypothetical protein ACLRQF_11500 [Thomasclavelia ramosa]